MEVNQIIRDVAEDITKICTPVKIILISTKTDMNNNLKSFKLCIVVDGSDISTLEHSLYMNVDCDIPYDLVFYQAQQWKNLSGQHDTFAGKIHDSGVVLYG